MQRPHCHKEKKILNSGFQKKNFKRGKGNEELTAIRKKLLKDLFESVLIHLSIRTLLFIIFISISVNCFSVCLPTCLKPLYIFLISCLLNFVSLTFIKRYKDICHCQEGELGFLPNRLILFSIIDFRMVGS